MLAVAAVTQLARDTQEIFGCVLLKGLANNSVANIIATDEGLFCAVKKKEKSGEEDSHPQKVE